MLTSASKSLPAIDYVSTVKAVYKDRRVMVIGTLATAVAALATGAQAQSALLYLHSGLFVLLALVRYLDMSAFARAAIAPDDAAAAAYWELRATVLGSVTAAVFGSWCFCSLMLVDSPYAEMTSISVTVAAMVGLVARNFGLDRLITSQILILGVPLALGLVLVGDVYHIVLAALLLPMTLSMRVAAADVRAILLNAVHGRVEASRLASELDAALDTLQHGLCMLDQHGRISVANDQALNAFTGLDEIAWGGRSFTELVEELAKSGRLPIGTTRELIGLVRSRGAGKLIISVPDGHSFEITVSSREQRTVLLFEDISERVSAQQRITFMARHDTLTGLHNRAYFSESVTNDLALRRQRAAQGDAPLAALMIFDLDDFKHVNDTLGHLAGDRLLIDAAARVRQVLPENVMLARLGGDEFIAYCSGVPAKADALADAETIRSAFRAPFALGVQSVAVNISVGIAFSSDESETLEQLMTKADLALYEAKANGKAQVLVFRDEMDVQYRYRQRLTVDLRSSIAAGSLTLAFQPVVDRASRRVVGCEALTRWLHPELGAIPPSVFIPLAEEIGVISEITRFVLNAACAECVKWPDHIGIAVNISARDFRSGEVMTMVEEALAASGLAPGRLELEITETAIIEQREAAIAMLTALAQRGIGIALDDFGTGYSSLSYLQVLPFTKLKIDRSFISGIAANQRSLKLLSNISRLGKDIGLTVTAEGVETEEQFQLIAKHTRVDQIQGYLFGVPLPGREVAELIGRMNAPQDVEQRRLAG